MYISLKAAQMFTHAMILSHMTCCVIILSQLVVEPVMPSYKNVKSNASETNEMASWSNSSQI